MTTIDLGYHGDRDAAPGLLDLAVNVRTEPPPAWLSQALIDACGRLAAYPDATEATAAVAARHARPPRETLLTAGAAEAFGLIALAVPAGPAVVVHPQFTEPERALRLAGHPVRRVVLPASTGFRLDPGAVPDEAGLVVIGNPTNPTGILHPARDLRALARPGRILVVDEAFLDAVPGEPESLAAARDVPGLVVVRSLTKTWGLAGLRIGYVLAAPPLIEALSERQPPWSVSTPALAAAIACSTSAARAEAATRASVLEGRRESLRADLAARGLVAVPGSRAPFLLVRSPDGRPLAEPLRAAGIAVRRAETFPGLGPEWFRVAVRAEEAARDRFLSALDAALAT